MRKCACVCATGIDFAACVDFAYKCIPILSWVAVSLAANNEFKIASSVPFIYKIQIESVHAFTQKFHVTSSEKFLTRVMTKVKFFMFRKDRESHV